jgi:hypothetical protein
MACAVALWMQWDQMSVKVTNIMDICWLALLLFGCRRWRAVWQHGWRDGGSGAHSVRSGDRQGEALTGSGGMTAWQLSSGVLVGVHCSDV